ncbi:MAG: c-type cytochrome [Chloroflexi bacterium]|nr:c-type cytochrome [Chloroflexota bacterium]
MDKNNKTTAFIFLLIGVFLLSACGANTELPTTPSAITATPVGGSETVVPVTVTQNTLPTSPSVGGEVSFANDVLPILKANCTRCHGTSRQSADLRLNTYDNLLAGSEGGPVIVPGDSTNSLLVELIVSGEMPKKGDKLPDQEIQIISDWINTGALDN